VTVPVRVCERCGRVAARPVLRCSRCGGIALRPETRPGEGTVLAATWTQAASFAAVELADGVRVLAIGERSRRVAGGDAVVVEARDDGTYALR
jgi:uncharacterized OB-fold protein